MSKAKPSLLLSLIACGALTLPLTSVAGIKCWTNRDGVRECGNMVPPEYAQQKSETINDQGITTDVRERAPTKEELEERRRQQEAEAKRLEEQKRQQELEAKRRQDQEAYDRMLLSTFLTEKDVTDSRDRKIGAIDATIELTRATIDKLQGNLDREKSRAAGFERQGKPVPKRSQDDIDSLQKQIDDKTSYIDSKEREKQQIIDKYAADLERFRALKAEGRRLR